jgi:hypothetical protein
MRILVIPATNGAIVRVGDNVLMLSYTEMEALVAALTETLSRGNAD